LRAAGRPGTLDRASAEWDRGLPAADPP